MDFNKKYHVYKKIKYDLPKIMKKNPAIFFGKGGSNNIIVVQEDVAIKVIPDFKKPPRTKIKSNNDKMEIEFYKLLTNEFLRSDVTPHIVGYYSNYKLLDIKKIFPRQCLTKEQKLFIPPEKINWIDDRLCYMKHEYDNYLMEPKADIIILENCSITIESQIKMILQLPSKKRYDNLISFIHRTIFQFIYTIAQIQSRYKNFIHNDMFLRNTLGIIEDKYQQNDYVEYIFHKKSYYLPTNGFYLKINDFGYSLNPPYITSTLEIDLKENPLSNYELHDPKRDVYTFLYDYFDGANFGSESVMRLIEKEKPHIKKMIEQLFKKYINVETIKKINKTNKHLLDWLWNIGDIKVLQDSVKLPYEYFDNGVFNQYKKLPKDGNVVKIFNFANAHTI